MVRRKSTENPLILAIDTSFDETSIALVKGEKVLVNAISSSSNLHKKYGGVVPVIARRAHEERLPLVLKEVFKKAKEFNVEWNNIDAIAVTFGPGLAIALEIGIRFATELSKKYEKPLIAVNHMEGHMLSALANNSEGKGGVKISDLQFPILGTLISGNHTEMVLMKSFGDYEIVGSTLDDAAGEAYDKVARMLNLGYPGGPVITEFSKYGTANKFKFPVPMHKSKSLDFSFSGLKTSIYYFLKKYTKEGKKALSKQETYDISTAFETAVLMHLQEKIDMAIKKFNPKLVLMGGGVISSPAVRQIIRSTARKNGIKAYYPYSKKLLVDNAAMIGIAAVRKFKQTKFVLIDLDRRPNAIIGEDEF